LIKIYKKFFLNAGVLFKKNEIVKKISIYLFFGIVINIFVGFLYFILLNFKFHSFLSLSISYILGVICSIYFNKNITFNFREQNSNIWIKFILLHILCYIICQVSNQFILHILKGYQYVLITGFIISVGLAAMTNFFGMYLIINFEKKN